MNVLFLDFDGVLNSGRFFQEHRGLETAPITTREAQLAATAPPNASLYTISPQTRRVLTEEHILVNDLRQLDPLAIPLLNEIVRTAEAKVVVSSAWRKIYSLDGLAWLLKSHGFEGEVIGVTPDFAKTKNEIFVRGHEIEAWLNVQKTPVTSFVCIDDDNDSGPVYERWVRTDFQVGITQAEVQEALYLFQNP